MSRRTSGFTLRLDEKLCNTLVNSIRGIVWEAEPFSFRFSYVSPQAERILGYPLRQWIEEEDFWRSHTHRLDVEWCSELCRNASARGEDHEFEYRMIAADGRIVWLHDIVTVAKDEAGAARLRGIMIDITEAKLAESRLRAEEERFRLAMQGTSDGIWDWNLATNELYCSSRWKSMLGYADDELESSLDTWFQLIHPADRDNVQAQVRKYLAGSLAKFETQYRMRHKHGGWNPSGCWLGA